MPWQELKEMTITAAFVVVVISFGVFCGMAAHDAARVLWSAGR